MYKLRNKYKHKPKHQYSMFRQLRKLVSFVAARRLRATEQIQYSDSSFVADERTNLSFVTSLPTKNHIYLLLYLLNILGCFSFSLRVT